MLTQSQKFYLLWPRSGVDYASVVASLGPLAWWQLNEASGQLADNAAYTAAPSAELLTNGDFADWTSPTLPDGWSQFGGPQNGSTIYLDEDPPDTLRYVDNGAQYLIFQSVMATGDTYRFALDVAQVDAGGLRHGVASNGPQQSTSSTGVNTFDAIATTAQLYVIYNSASSPADVRVNSASVRKVGELDAQIGGTTTLAQAGMGNLGTAYYFDGATSFLQVVNRAALQGLAALSLGFAIYRMGPGEGSAPDLAHKANEWQVSLNSTGNVVVTVHRATTDATATTNESISAYQWQMVHVTYTDADGIKIYIDGAEATYSANVIGSGARVSNTNDIYFGNNAAASATFQGRIADITFFDSALSAANIAQLYSVAGITTNDEFIELEVTTTGADTIPLGVTHPTQEILVEWGDGGVTVIAANTASDVSHTYPGAGVYNLRVYGDLSGITHLYFDNCKLTGSIPVELGNLSNLQYLYLHNNQLTGSIPVELGNLSNLDRMYLSGNQLTGSIPPELGNLSNLTQLYLSINQLTGSIPAELGNLSNLVQMLLQFNQLTGTSAFVTSVYNDWSTTGAGNDRPPNSDYRIQANNDSPDAAALSLIAAMETPTGADAGLNAIAWTN